MTDALGPAVAVAGPRGRGPIGRRALVVILFGVLATANCGGQDAKSAVSTTPSATTTTATVRPASARGATAITVANKVAIGSQSYVEDSTPAYLSTVPQPFCASRGCQVPRSALTTGQRVVADCQVTGAQMYNYNLAEQGAGNPHAASSNLWYHVQLPGEVAGYLSEVYVDAHDRGGRGLPACG